MTKGNSNQTAGNQAQNWSIPLPGLRRIREAPMSVFASDLK